MTPDILSTGDLFLGPVHFQVEFGPPLYPFGEDENLYAAFRIPASGLSIRRRCRVHLTDRKFEVDFSEVELVFDSGPAWKIYQTAAGERLILRTCGQDTGSSHVLWLARIRPDFSEVTVHVGEGMKISGASGPGLANPLCYPLDQLLMLHLMPCVDTLLVHGACIDFGYGAEVYAGRSGAGKTTFSRLVESSGLEAEIITDDRVLLVRTEAGWVAGGTPWPGEGRYALNTWRPLHNLNLLIQGDQEGFVSLVPADVLAGVLPMLSVPYYDESLAVETLDLCGKLVEEVPGSRFEFRKDSAAVRAAAERAGMSAGKGAPTGGE